MKICKQCGRKYNKEMCSTRCWIELILNYRTNLTLGRDFLPPHLKEIKQWMIQNPRGSEIKVADLFHPNEYIRDIANEEIKREI